MVKQFYLKSWFIVVLVVVATGLLFAVLFLQEVINQLELLRGKQSSIGDETKTDEAARQLIANSPSAPSYGNADSPLQVVGFFDFNCPFSGEAANILAELESEFPNQMNFQFRHYALSPESRQLASASMCAAEQGKFWEYYKELYQNQPVAGFPQIKKLADDIGVEPTQFSDCLTNERMGQIVSQDFSDAKKLGVLATPTFFINGHKVEGVIPQEIWKELLGEIR